MFNQASEAKRFDKTFLTQKIVQISKIHFLHAGAGAKVVKNYGFHSNVEAKSLTFWRYHEIEFSSIKLSNIN